MQSAMIGFPLGDGHKPGLGESPKNSNCRSSYQAVPVEVPPPGQSLEPGQGSYYPPRPVPYDELVTTFPASISERYVPQDNPFHGTTLPSYRSSSFARKPGQTATSQKKLVDPAFAVDSIGW